MCDIFLCEKGTHFPCGCNVGIAIKRIGEFNCIGEYKTKCLFHDGYINLYIPVQHSTKWLDKSFSDNIKELLCLGGDG